MGARKLTDEQVLEIRSLAATKRVKDVAKKFGISTGLVSMTSRGLLYGHVPGNVIPTRTAGQQFKGKYGEDYYKRLWSMSKKGKQASAGAKHETDPMGDKL